MKVFVSIPLTPEFGPDHLGTATRISDSLTASGLQVYCPAQYFDGEINQHSPGEVFAHNRGELATSDVLAAFVGSAASHDALIAMGLFDVVERPNLLVHDVKTPLSFALAGLVEARSHVTDVPYTHLSKAAREIIRTLRLL